MRTDGPLFKQADGTQFRYKGITAFKLPQRWQAGEDVSAFLKDARTISANTFRVFLQHRFLDWPTINAYVMPIEQVRPFTDWCAAQGFYVELTVLCDTQSDGFNQSDAWCTTRVAEVLREVRDAPNVFVELMNEPPFNGGYDRVRKIVNGLGLARKENRPVLMASGLYPDTGAESRTEMLPLDYCGDHPPRKPSWPTETAKTAYYQYRQLGVAIVQDEPIGSAEQDSGSRDASVENWEDAGGGMGLSSAGGTFHCEDGIHARPLGPKQLACGTAFFRAMDSIPIECVNWTYAHDGADPHPLRKVAEQYGVSDEEAAKIVGEVASRVSGSRAYVVAQQPSARWMPELREGWRIVGKLNARGTILRLEK